MGSKYGKHLGAQMRRAAGNWPSGVDFSAPGWVNRAQVVEHNEIARSLGERTIERCKRCGVGIVIDRVARRLCTGCLQEENKCQD